MNIERIESHGIVGAGGGGFPTAVKLQAQASIFLVNAAECEPLLHKDKELMKHQSEPMLRGLQAAMSCVGAEEAVIGIKDKYTDVMASLKPQLPSGVRIAPLSDSYPAGDEFILVHDITGRIIPPGGLPKDVGAAVANVETLMNIGLDRPVTHKYLTVAGAVKTPVTLRVPVGLSLAEAMEAAGGATVAPYAILLGGVMMARLADSPDQPITKTTGGIIVLPTTHPLVQRHGAKWGQIARVGRSACDQCRFCTEMCPRYLLGHPIEPHAAMRALGFTEPPNPTIAGTLYCCECNLCSLYACPEDLDPKNVCVESKPIARERGLVFKGAPEDVKVHPLAEGRRVPTRRLMARLALNEFRNVGPLVEHEFTPQRVVLPLKQHAGAPAEPTVKAGQRVKEGDLVARPAEGQLGARIHASIDGTVRSTDGSVEIES
ncbi:MAG: SLBB domain-containing protein [Acidobacteria bacterium]|jgi:Na+-translocating ferredoxin:NAD+ oxidoreductase RnfC subunit|nr:SLBB domain-containing protein [Acidobacteriota bacterium]